MRFAFLVCFCDSTSDVSVLAARCHQVLHGFQCRYDLRIIGVAYPRWNEYSVGDEIAFVCHDKEVLRQFSQQKFFSSMKRGKKFDYGDIISIQEGGAEVQYCRTQKPDKYKQAWLDRDDRRRKKRGIEPRKHIPQTQILEHYHSLRNRKGYLHIQRKPAHQIAQGDYSTYGLAGETNPGTVPL